MRVSRYNYPHQFGDEIDRLTAQIRRMLLEGRYVLTAEVSDFENDFAHYLHARHVVGVNSGMDALLLALMTLDIRAGDEVITQANTFNATVAAICLAGATPVLVDAKDDTFQMDAGQVEASITPKTRAIIPVHLYGKPAPMDAILPMAKTHNLKVIEDAAQAHGARIGDRAVGTIGHVGCFSFHPSKNLAAAGDGGALVTSNDKLAIRCRQQRALGQRDQNDHVWIGFNSKLNPIQALILRHKLRRLDRWNQHRRLVARWYREGIGDLLRFQVDDADESVFHLFPVRTERRDSLLRHLRNNGIDAVIRYPVPVSLQPAFERFGWRKGQFPVAERLAKELVCLPIRPDMTSDEVEYVVDCIRDFHQKNGD